MRSKVQVTAGETAAAIAAGEVSAAEVVEGAIGRLEANDERLQVVARELFDRARKQARRADAELASGDPVGPLHGVPFGVKDLFDLKGVETGLGSPLASGTGAPATATSVARLEWAGAIPIAKLAMTELAGVTHHRAHPAPVNPYHPDHGPGGSSSGSGVAVAAGLVPFALGSDTVASIRIPAAWNGCVGFKPSYGRTSRHGVFPLAPTYDHGGPLAVSVEDAAQITLVLAGRDPEDPTTRPDSFQTWEPGRDPGRLRIGFDATFVEGLAAPPIAACSRAAVDALADAGAEIVPISIPLREEAIDHYHASLLAEVGYVHRAFFPARRSDYTAAFAALLDAAAAVEPGQLVEAAAFRIGFDRAIEELFDTVDALVLPVAPFNAPPGGGRSDDVRLDRDTIAMLQFTWLWNFCGAPAVAVPWGLDAGGLPNSVQVVARPGHDARALEVAAAVERLAEPLPPPPLDG